MAIYGWENDIIGDIVFNRYDGYFVIGDMEGEKIDFNHGVDYCKPNYTGEKVMQSKKTWKIEIADFLETREYYEFKFALDQLKYQSMNISEIALFNKNDEMCFYSCRKSNILSQNIWFFMFL